MTSLCGGRVVFVLLVAAATGAASCTSNSDSSRKQNPGDAADVSDAPVTSAPAGAVGVGGSASSGGTTGESGGSGGGGGAATPAGGVSGSTGSGGRGGAVVGGSTSETSGSSGSGSGTSASGGATVSTGGATTVDAGGGDGSASRPDGAAGRDARGRDAGTGGAGADASGSPAAGGVISSSTGSDGCTDSQAANLTLQQIAVYQSVKIPIMTNGAEVATASRNSAVVAGRDTLFRIFVTLGSGWTVRDLSARLTLTPSGGQATQYYAKQTVSASSTDASLATTFQVLVPASAMTGAMTYSLAVVECGTQSGTAGTARFPASGDADLGVKTTGGLKITVVPIQVGTLLPDTSQATLDLYASQMAAMYPINAIALTVGGTITTTSPVDWTTMLDQVRAKRAQDAPSADAYYFGLVKPANTLRAYCQTSCTSGIGYVVTKASQASTRAAVGVAFADSPSTLTMAHEVGHNHGRQHSPCSLKGETISGVYPNYPYANGLLGSWGWDCRTQTLFDPSKATDIMGYCTNQWMSDYTYAGIATRVAAVNGQPSPLVHALSESLSKWRVLLLDATGPRWGVPIEQEVAPEGEPETATIYDESGAVSTSVVVYRTEIGDADASMVWVPEPQPGWYAVAVTGASPHPFAAPVTVPRP